MKLNVISMSELYDTVFTGKQALIEGFLYQGAYLFVGAPKIGKSFMVAQIAYHISMGIHLWNYPVQQGTVFYLALEDSQQRLQERLYRMFGVNAADNLYFSVDSNKLGSGLEEEMQEFIKVHPDTKLIIIDILQKVRDNAGSDNYSYANDYQLITRLKCFADYHNICIMLVHHTRKQKADDNLEMISGTNGLLGAADGVFLMSKTKRTGSNATIEISGRDQQDTKLHLVRNSEKLSWDLERAETELWKEPPEPILDMIAKLVTAESPEWRGTAVQLVERLALDIKPNILTRRLNVNAGRLFNEYGICYSNKHTHDSRIISLWLKKE